GNGKATATLFAREGARVTCVDRDLVSAEETVAIIRSEGGVAHAALCDVTASEQVLKVVQAVIEREGRIDVLQNNVGYATMGGPIELT
ncbi:SDR family NAD(P)-dependent oxidoreductase, partial [Streptomyces galilaeus]|uniref:SDR family NAD(P)-dependent oxidoreductase n=1 Tax=Streptomyces galilaeus TaxID=33899 RepID=UPI0038F78169